jgi:hypothetical protein
MLKIDANPGGLPIGAFGAIRAGVSADRSPFYAVGGFKGAFSADLLAFIRA